MGATDLDTTIDDLLACVVNALEAADRPVCSEGLTIGPPPWQICCECDTDTSGRASAFLERIYPVSSGTTFEQETRLENCRPGAVAADISIVVRRCYPAAHENLTMPDLDETTPPAHDLNTDITVVWTALKCCGSVAVREAGVDADPVGGCSAFAIRVTSLVSIPANEVVGS